jgi:hypothetical protein
MEGWKGWEHGKREKMDEICQVGLVSEVSRGTVPSIIYYLRNPTTECESFINPGTSEEKPLKPGLRRRETT